MSPREELHSPVWHILETPIRWVDGVELWSTKRKSKKTKEVKVQQLLREILTFTFWNRSSKILENPSSNHVPVYTLSPGRRTEPRPTLPPFPSFFKMIIIYAIVSRDVLLKHLPCRSFSDLGWSKNIRAYWLFESGTRSLKREGNLSLLALTSVNISLLLISSSILTKYQATCFIVWHLNVSLFYLDNK